MKMKNWKAPMLCAGALFALAGSLSAFELVKDGKTAEIVLPENAHPSTKLAAKELSDYTGKVTGKKPAVVTGKSAAANRVYIGTLDTLKNIPASAVKALKSAKQDEAHFICAKGNTLYIIGKQEVADLYATYQFIEDKLGVRWLKAPVPGDSGEYVPKKAEITFADYEKFREPAFAIRWLVQGASQWNAIPVQGKTWANRNGYQTPTPYDIPIPYNQPESARCKFYSARIPRSHQPLGGGGHMTFVDPMRPNKAFGQHPEYFALIDGKRVKGTQYCLSNPEVRRNVADSIIRKLDASKGQGFYLFGMADVDAGWCECAECKKLDGTDSMARGFQNVSTRFQKTVRAIAEMVYEKYPDADLRVWAYHTYRELPDGVTIHPKMKVQFCPHGRCYGHRLDDPNCPRNASLYKLLQGWLKIAPAGVYTYEYLGYSFAFYSCEEMIQGHDFRLYKKLGMLGWREDGFYPDSKFIPRIEKLGMKNWLPSNWQWAYVTGKLLWDPRQDVTRLLDEIESLYYGKAYPVMKKYHALRRKLWSNTPQCLGYPRGDGRRPYLLNVPGSREELNKLLDEAVKLAEGDKLLQFRIANDRSWLNDYWVKSNEKMKEQASKVMRAPTASSKIVIDGEGKDRAWVGAYYLTSGLKQPLTPEKKVLPAELKTTLGILSDNDNLYFLITAMEPSPAKMKLTGKPDVNVWGDDCIEIFLYPPTAANVYYHLVINPKGAVYDAIGRNPGEQFSIPVEVKTKILKDRYVIEARVPLAKLKQPERGEIWKISFARNRTIDDTLTPAKVAHSGNFSLDGASYHDVAAFRSLEIGTPYLLNGSFEELDKKGNPKHWVLRKKSAVVKSGNGNALKICGDAFQNLVGPKHPLNQKPVERKVSYTFTASGKGKVKVYFHRYTSIPDPKTKSRSTRKYLGSSCPGVYTLKEHPQVFSGKYTIKANEWAAFALYADDAVVDDVSLRLVK